MMTLLHRLFDTQDASIAVHDVFVAIAFIGLLVFSGWSVFKTGQFEAQGYGSAVGIILGGGGLAAIGQAAFRHGGKKNGLD